MINHKKFIAAIITSLIFLSMIAFAADSNNPISYSKIETRNTDINIKSNEYQNWQKGILLNDNLSLVVCYANTTVR